MYDFIKAIQTEAAKPGLAASSAFVLVEWNSSLLQVLADSPYWNRWGLDIIISQAQALESCLSSSPRANVKHSALVITRRGLRKAFSQKEIKRDAINGAVDRLTSKNNKASAKNAVMIGVISGVCARQLEAKAILDEKKSDIYAFYNREILGSRTVIPSHLATSMDDFFSAFSTKEDIEKDIVPSLEKALLRSPEVVLNDLVTPLIHALPNTIDLSDLLRSNLLKPLLSSVKSTNAVIRQGALSAFKAAVAKCGKVDVVGQIAEEILSPLKLGKLSSPDQRAIHAEMLSVLPVSKAIAINSAPAISAVVGKETNDTALSSESSTLLRLALWQVQNEQELDKATIEAFVKGLSGKKASSRRLWFIRFGELMWDTERNNLVNSSSLMQLMEGSMPSFLDIWQEFVSNSVAAAQTGLVPAAYIFTTISKARLNALSSSKIDSALKKAQVTSQALSVEPKLSFLLNHRIYGKLTHDDDFLWFIRALSALSEDVLRPETDSNVAVAWIQALIFCVSTATISHKLRHFASKTLSQIHGQHPSRMSKLTVCGLWQWVLSVERDEKDSPAAAAKQETSNFI